MTYVEPHRIIINDITFLAFNYSTEIFIENLSNKIKLSEFIQNVIDRLFNCNSIDIKYFKEQYDPEIKRKREKEFESRRRFNLFSKKEIEKATKHINQEMEESAKTFILIKKIKKKTMAYHYNINFMIK